jgi:predicted kinase
MPKVYVLVGVPGAGKSTWVANQEWAKDCAYVSTDLLVDQEADRQGKTYNDVFKDYMPMAVKLMADDVVKAREAGQDIIWDQTSTTVGSRKKKFNMLPNYEHIAVVFKTPELVELNRRLKSRPGKSIPSHVMVQMIKGWQDPTLDEGYAEVWNAG